MRELVFGVLLLAIAATVGAAPSDGPTFGAKMFLTEDAQSFIDDWQTSLTAQPKIATQVEAGGEFDAVVMYWGGAPDAQGHCDISMRPRVLRQSGELLMQGREQTVCRGNRPEGDLIKVSETILSLTATAQPEVLTVQVVLTDHVSSETVQLSAPIEVVVQKRSGL